MHRCPSEPEGLDWLYRGLQGKGLTKLNPQQLLLAKALINLSRLSRHLTENAFYIRVDRNKQRQTKGTVVQCMLGNKQCLVLCWQL